MAGDRIPGVGNIEKPEKLDALLKADRDDDCLSCRIVGGGAFLGLAGYSYWSGTTQLERQRAQILARKSMFGIKSRKMGLTATCLGLAWMGVYRLFF